MTEKLTQRDYNPLPFNTYDVDLVESFSQRVIGLTAQRGSRYVCCCFTLLQHYWDTLVKLCKISHSFMRKEWTLNFAWFCL